MSTVESESFPAGAPPRCLAMDRRRCIVTPDRVEIRPCWTSVLLPVVGLVVGLLAVGAVAFGQGDIALPVVVLLVLAAVVVLPLSGIGVLSSAVCGRIVVDRARQSAVWERGLLGLGVGTREVVPFWKIQQLEVGEVAPSDEWRLPRDVARFEVTLVKTSGRRLRLGVVTASRSSAADGLNGALLVAEAIAGVAGKPVHVVKSRRRRPRIVRSPYVPSRR